MVSEYKNSVKNFSIESFGLPFLPIEAAKEIAKYIVGKEYDEEPINHLSKLLDEATFGEDPLAKIPENNLVLRKAMIGDRMFSYFFGRRNIEEIVLQTNLVAKELKNIKKINYENKISLYNFCLNLGKGIAHYQDKESLLD